MQKKIRVFISKPKKKLLIEWVSSECGDINFEENWFIIIFTNVSWPLWILPRIEIRHLLSMQFTMRSKVDENRLITIFTKWILTICE